MSISQCNAHESSGKGTCPHATGPVSFFGCETRVPREGRGSRGDRTVINHCGLGHGQEYKWRPRVVPHCGSRKTSIAQCELSPAESWARC